MMSTLPIPPRPLIAALCLPAVVLAAGVSSWAAPRPQATPACVVPAVPADYLVYHALAAGPVAPLAPRQDAAACGTRKAVRT